MRQPPDQDAGSWLVQMPTLSLLGLVMSTAKWCQVALTRASSLIMRQRVIVIASAGSSSAAWERTGSLPDLDDVVQGCGNPVPGHLTGMRADPGLDRANPDVGQPMCLVTEPRRVARAHGTVSTGVVAARARMVAAWVRRAVAARVRRAVAARVRRAVAAWVRRAVAAWVRRAVAAWVRRAVAAWVRRAVAAWVRRAVAARGSVAAGGAVWGWAAGTAVGDSSTGLVGEGDAPPGSAASGDPLGKLAAGSCIGRAKPGDLPRGGRESQPGG